MATCRRSNSGLAVLEKYGPSYMRELGRKGGLVGHGGRPRALTLQAITTRLAEGNMKGECATNTDSLERLRAAWEGRKQPWYPARLPNTGSGKVARGYPTQAQVR